MLYVFHPHSYWIDTHHSVKWLQYVKGIVQDFGKFHFHNLYSHKVGVGPLPSSERYETPSPFLKLKSNTLSIQYILTH